MNTLPPHQQHPSGAPPPGWFTDPSGAAGLERWWDGQRWGEHTRQAQPPPNKNGRGCLIGGLIGGALLVILIVALAVVGSTIPESPTASQEAPTASTTDEERPSAPEQPEASAIDDAIELEVQNGERVKVTVTGTTDPVDAGQYQEPEAGNRYVGVRLRVENVGSNDVDEVLSNGAKAIVSGDEQVDATIITGGTCDSDFGSSLKLSPGSRRNGCIPFEIGESKRLRQFQLTLASGFAGDTGEWDLR